MVSWPRLLLFAHILVFATPVPGPACSCTGPFPEEWRSESTHVFRGRVIALTPFQEDRLEDGRVRRHEATEVTFEVRERFKGPEARAYKILYGHCATTLGSQEGCLDMCSMDGVEKKAEYVVFAAPGSLGRPMASDCTTFAVDDERATYSLQRLRGSK